jgi:hypothetical protein
MPLNFTSFAASADFGDAAERLSLPARLRSTLANRAAPTWLTSRASERVGRRLERETGIEPATNSLEGCDSTTELLPPSCSALRRGWPSRPRVSTATPGGSSTRQHHAPRSISASFTVRPQLACQPKPANGNDLACPAEGFPSRGGLPSRSSPKASEGWWRGEDSNLRRR